MATATKVTTRSETTAFGALTSRISSATRAVWESFKHHSYLQVMMSSGHGHVLEDEQKG